MELRIAGRRSRAEALHTASTMPYPSSVSFQKLKFFQEVTLNLVYIRNVLNLIILGFRP